MLRTALPDRLLRLLQRAPSSLSLPEIAQALDLTEVDAERTVRKLLRTHAIAREHQGFGQLRYIAASMVSVARPDGPHGTLCRPVHTFDVGRSTTARILAVLAHYQAPLRRAEIVILGRFSADPKQASRVSATLCMLTKRKRLRRDVLGGGSVAYALPGAAQRAAAPLSAGEIAAAGFRPTIERSARRDGPFGIDTACAPTIRISTVNQRLRRGWPPELALALPLLRRSAA